MNRSRWTFSLILALTVAAPAKAFWTFSSINNSSEIRCSGEANNDDYAPSCDIYSSWGTHVSAFDDGGNCLASVECPPGLIRGCHALETWGETPAICTAWSYNLSDPYHPTRYKALCKSDAGSFSEYCD